MKHQDLERHIKAGEIDRVTVSRNLSHPEDKGKFRLFAYGELLPPSTVNMLESTRGGPRLFRDLETVVGYLLDMGLSTFEVETIGAGAASQPAKPSKAEWMQMLIEAVPESGWISAMAWKRAQPSLADIDDEGFLITVLASDDALERQGIRCELVENPPEHPLSGNISVRDAMLGRH